MGVIKDMAMATEQRAPETVGIQLAMPSCGIESTVTAVRPKRIALTMAVIPLCLSVVTSGAIAQTATQASPLSLPSLGQFGQAPRPSAEDQALSYGVRSTVLLSNNLDLRPDGVDSGHGLMEITPYVNYNLLTPRGPISASASLRAQVRDGDANGFLIRSNLRASADQRLVGEWLFLSARASIQTVNLDPFGANSVDPGAQAANTSSLKDFEISPYMKGKFDGQGTWNAAYRLRYIDLSNTASVASIYSGSNVQQTLQGGLRTDLTRRTLGLSAETRLIRADYRNGLAYDGAEADLLAWLRLNPTLRVAAGWGWAYNSRLFNRAGDDRGAGLIAALEWNPTPRTDVKARWADRYYGNQISASADHRYGAWTFGLAYAKGVQDGNTSNLYGLLQQQLAASQALLASSGTVASSTSVIAGLESSPAAVAAAALNPALQFSGVLASPLVYYEQASASFRIQGARTAIQGAVFVSDRSSALNLVGLPSADINQWGASLAASYRLDGAQTLNLGLRTVRTESSASASEAHLQSIVASWDRRMTSKWTLSLGGRLQKQTGTGATVEYDEAAVFVATDYRLH